MSRKYHKDTFDKISPEKKDRILEAAAAEFSFKGFDRARVSDIAKKAGVSHGSIYTYFETKDDILNYIIQQITELQESGFEIENGSDKSIEELLRILISRSFETAAQKPYLMSCWLSLSFEFNSRFSAQIKEIELQGIRGWQKLLRDAADKGEIPAEMDLTGATYIVDSVVANILRAFISEHEKMKLDYHFGSGVSQDEMADRVVKSLLKFLK